MNKTLLSRKIFSWGSLALATSLLVSLLVPSAQANTYSLPNAPTNVTSYLGAKGVVVKWTAGASVAPGVTGHVVSAGEAKGKPRVKSVERVELLKHAGL